MGVYEVGTLLNMWKSERMEVEKAMGQSLQHLVNQDKQQTKIFGRVSGLEDTNQKLAQAQEQLIIKMNHMLIVMNKLLNLPSGNVLEQEAVRSELAQLQKELTPLKTDLIVKPKKVNRRKQKMKNES